MFYYYQCHGREGSPGPHLTIDRLICHRQRKIQSINYFQFQLTSTSHFVASRPKYIGPSEMITPKAAPLSFIYRFIPSQQGKCLTGRVLFSSPNKGLFHLGQPRLLTFLPMLCDLWCQACHEWERLRHGRTSRRQSQLEVRAEVAL